MYTLIILYLHITGSLFDTVNVTHDKLEAKERQKLSKTRVGQCMHYTTNSFIDIVRTCLLYIIIIIRL